MTSKDISVLSIFIGFLSIFITRWFHDAGFLIVLGMFIILSFIFSFVQRQPAWQWGAMMLVSNYIAGFFWIPSWGELLPFDLIFLVIYLIPCGLAGYLGIYLGNRIFKPTLEQ